MDKAKEEALLRDLGHDEQRIINDFPSDVREKILSKLGDGYTVTKCDRFEVEVKKGYSYYNIERSGRMYQV